ncbi:MAG TPA: hypothetical protein PKZ27_16520 [Rhodocyclaceae bacterium]|nr:hypothetical protein [Rhodocyclaceae bacterium]
MWNLIIWVVTAALSFALQKKPPSQPAPMLGDIKAPTAEEGREIPVLFGTRDIEAPNVVWYGHLRTKAIKKKGGKK